MTTIITPDTVATVLKPTLHGWTAHQLKDVIFRGITFKAQTEGPVVRLTEPVNVAFEACTWAGDPLAAFGLGLEAVGARNLAIRKCALTGLATGLKLVDGDGLAVEENELTLIRADGVIYSGQRDYRIDRNSFSEWRPVGLKHPDAIQAVRPDLRNKASERGKIRQNTIVVRGAQGIFVPQTVETEISDNFIATNLATAIGVGKSLNCTLLRNAIGTYPTSTTQAGIDAREAVGLVCDEASRPHQYRWRKSTYVASA